MSHRNPYVILGLPFGAGREEAKTAFIRRSRPLRRSSEAAAREALTDLTWALNQVEDTLREPENELGLYRIPAEPDGVDASGVLRPPPERLAPVDGDHDAELERLRAAVAHEYLRYLVAVRANALGPCDP